MSDELVVHLKRAQLLGRLLAGLVFVAIGVWFLSHDSVERWLVGIVAITFFGAGSLWVLLRLLKPGPAVIIDCAGITDNASAMSVGFVPWHEVGELGYYEFGRQAFLTLALTDPDAVMARANPAKRVLIRWNMRHSGSPVNIPVGVLSIGADELAQEIEQRRSAER